MDSLSILYVTAVLLAVVAIACTTLCIIWSNPNWRRRIAFSRGAIGSAVVAGWSYRLGSGLVSAGIGTCALIAWYGCYCVLAALS